MQNLTIDKLKCILVTVKAIYAIQKRKLTKWSFDILERKSQVQMMGP